MTSIARQELGPTLNNRRWAVDVIVDGSPDTYLGVFGVQDFKPTLEYTDQDDSDYASGWSSKARTKRSHGVEIKVKRGIKAGTEADPEYDPGQEALRLAALSEDGRIGLRFYTLEGPKEAYEGTYLVAWSPDGGASDGIETATVTCSGVGARLSVVHPDGA